MLARKNLARRRPRGGYCVCEPPENRMTHLTSRALTWSSDKARYTVFVGALPPRNMPSASRAMLLCGAFVALSVVVPSQPGDVGNRISTGHSPFAAAHDPGSAQQQRHHQCRRSARQQQWCRRQLQEAHPSAAFAVLARAGRRPNSSSSSSSSSRELGRTREITPRFVGATSTYARHRRRRRGSSGLPRCGSTWLTASASPGDVYFTSQVLSPAEILEYVRRVDFFDLPPGGVTAGEAGYQRALPLQVCRLTRCSGASCRKSEGELAIDLFLFA